MIEYNVNVFKDSGVHICFVPIFITVGTDDKPLSKHDMAQYGISIDPAYQYDASHQIEEDFAHDFINSTENSEWEQLSPNTPFIRVKTGHVVYNIANDANEYFMWGMHLAFETNTGDNERGYIVDKRPPTDEEIGRNASNPTYRPISSPYIGEEENCSFVLEVLDRIDVQVNIVWREEKHLENQNVDIILDFGNTRTCAILLEEFSDKPADTLRTLCRPLQLDESNDNKHCLDSAIVPSWFIMHQAMFDNSLSANDALLMDDWKFTDEIRGKIFKKRYKMLSEIQQKHPHMFGRNSLIMIGKQAQKLYGLEKIREEMMHGMKIEQSSPKRYYWDTGTGSSYDQVEWSMVNNGAEFSGKKSPCSSLNGELLRFLPVDGSILDFAHVNQASILLPERPFYPRATTITLFLYDILEKAWSQINSSVFSDNDISKKRRINKFIATFPSGWSMDEIEKYKLRFQEAIDIFHALNFREEEPKIKLEMPLDEGAASQLPIIFSEIRKCDEDYTTWIENNTRHNEKYVRVMNIDIGGGTTDIAIIEYGQIGKVSGAVAIDSQLIFKDGCSIGGDDLLRRIIEKMILPVLAFSSNMPDKVKQLYAEPGTEIEKKKRVQHVKLCLIPIAIKILQCAVQDTIISSIDPIDDAEITQDIWSKFESYLGIPSGCGRYIPIDITVLDHLVSQIFSGIFSKCAKNIEEYDVDMVILSGKTSELAEIYTLTTKNLKNIKIISSGKYETGNWFPFSSTGKIEDAKSVTAVGAALFSAISNGMISGWSIQFHVSETMFKNNEWNVLSDWQKNVKRAGFLGTEDDSGNVTLLVNSVIARRQNASSKYEPRYKLVWKDNKVVRPNLPIDIVFERIPGNGDVLEKLVIRKAVFHGVSIDKSSARKVGDIDFTRAVQVIKITSDDLELKDWFSEDSDYCFWQDSGKFVKKDELDDKIRELLVEGQTQSKEFEANTPVSTKLKTKRLQASNSAAAEHDEATSRSRGVKIRL